MKKIIGLLIISISIITFINCGKKTFPAVNFPFYIVQENFDTTKTIATNQDKNIFLMFHADWCSICNTFKTSVLTSIDIKNTLQNKIITSLIDGDKTYGKPYATQFGITGYPTFLVLDKSGMELSRRVGGMDEATFKAWITPYLK
jgi:thioredoxin-related protein